jgi:predicted RND superfamily exporter protein
MGPGAGGARPVLAARRPRLVLALVALLGLACLLVIVDPRTGTSRLHVDPSVDNLLPDADPELEYYDALKRRFGNDQVVVLAAALDPFEDVAFERLERLTRRLEAQPEVQSATSLVNAADFAAGPDGLEIGALVPAPPRTREDWERARRALEDHPIHGGTLVSRDGEVAAIAVTLRPMPDREFLARALDARWAAIAREELGVPVAVSGPLRLKAETSRTLVADLRIAVPLAFAVILGAALAFHRSWRGVLIPAGCVALGVLATLALMVLLDDPVSIVTAIVPPLVISIGFAYVNHVLAEYDAALRDPTGEGARDPVSRAVRHNAGPLVLCAVTTVLGFLSLLTSPMHAIREFGLYSIAGTLATLALSLSFAPACLAVLGPPREVRARRGEGGIEDGLERVARIAFDHRRAVYAVALAIAAAALAATPRIRVAMEVVENFSPRSEVRRDFEVVNRRLGGATPMWVVIEGEEAGALWDPARLRALDELGAWLRAQPEVGSLLSPVDLLKRLNEALHDGDPAARAVPAGREAAAQLLHFARSEGGERLLDARYRTAALVVRLQVVATSDLQRVVERIEARLAALPAGLRGRLTGESLLVTRTVDDISRGQAWSLATACVTIFAALAIHFRSARLGFLAMLPNLLPVLVYFGLLGATGVTLNNATALLGPIVLGIAVDDTLHFFARFRTEVAAGRDPRSAVLSVARSVGRPVTTTTVALCLGFLVLAGNDLRNQAQFGALGSLTLAFAWLCEVLLTPAICRAMRLPGVAPGSAPR